MLSEEKVLVLKRIEKPSMQFCRKLIRRMRNLSTLWGWIKSRIRFC